MRFLLILGLFYSISSLSEEVISSEPILPLPFVLENINSEKISLGKKLFEDKILSRDNTISCSSCHNLYHGGADGRDKSVGINGLVGDINSPTVFNSGFNFRQFWNGRAKTLEEQMDGPIEHPKEMGSSWGDVLAKLKANKSYTSLFMVAYQSEVTKDNIKDAIATFQRSLVTSNSRFDQFLRGKTSAISEIEKSGYQRFKSFGCVACHQGMNVGGNMFQTMGIMGNYFKERGTPITSADLGRYTVTKDEYDRHVFRVPSLRNIELTPPYFHDGSAKTLDEAVRVMAKYQLKRRLSKEDVDSIVAFLKTLTGELPKSLKDHAK